jgi:hypothetical protein
MTLRDKLKALTSPCREVDAEIAMMFNVPVTHLLSNPPIDATPHYTASLDDTVELVEREMPDALYGWVRIHSEYWAFVGQGQEAKAHTLPAVALLLALLDAKVVNDGGH